MDAGMKITELASVIEIAADMVINWKLHGMKLSSALINYIDASLNCLRSDCSIKTINLDFLV